MMRDFPAEGKLFRGRSGYRVLVFIILALFAVTSFLISLRFGSLKLSFTDVVRAIFIADASDINREIICMVRLPRNLTAMMAGICLSLSGAILQGVMRNPLAAPNIIGVSSGGGLAAIFIMIVIPHCYNLLVPAAFVGALAATFTIFLLAWDRGIRPMRLILSGVAVSSLLGAFISALMIFYPDRVPGILDFMVGGFNGCSWRHVNIIWPYAVFGTIAVFFMGPRLNILVLGDETATSLGLRIEQTRIILLVLSSLLAAAAVSVAGLLGFVGLIVPHTMRMIIGSDHRVLFPACVLFSSGLLLLCDTLGRVLLDPRELPVGIIMSILGAPFFLYLLRIRGTFRHENKG